MIPLAMTWHAVVRMFAWPVTVRPSESGRAEVLPVLEAGVVPAPLPALLGASLQGGLASSTMPVPYGLWVPYDAPAVGSTVVPLTSLQHG